MASNTHNPAPLLNHLVLALRASTFTPELATVLSCPPTQRRNGRRMGLPAEHLLPVSA